MTAPALDADLGIDFDLPKGSRVVIVAPHPDDEVFAVGGTMAVLASRGCAIEIVAVTDGEASHASSTRITPAELRTTRERESWEAYRLLGIDPVIRRLGLPDSGVSGHGGRLRAALREHFSGAALCFAPIETDGHPDHDATGAAAREIAAELRIPLARYAVWARLNPGRIVQGIPRTFALPSAVRMKKLAAIRVYESQLKPLGPLPEDGPVLPGGFLDHFSQEGEPLWPVT